MSRAAPAVLPFSKYHGAGNDFVCVDDRGGAFAKTEHPALLAALCHRRFGIGADGLILLRADASAADGLGLRMVYYNSDGAPSSFCGNGSRCFLAFARELGLIGGPGQTALPSVVEFDAADGRHRGEVTADAYRVSMRIGGGVARLSGRDDRVETGSPHFVRWCEVLPEGDITAEARAIRYGGAFAKTGINVNYVAEEGAGLAIRTYERGVEDETLACGTGVTAAVLSFAERRKMTGEQRVAVRAVGGHLAVEFSRTEAGGVRDVVLEGPAVKSFGGTIDLAYVRPVAPAALEVQ